MDVEAHWRDIRTALHYARAAVAVGLWNSERRLCEAHLPRGEPLLELGCGGGRIALGLWREGWARITPTDLSPAMVELADAVFAEAGCPFRASQADARQLPFANGAFAGAVFGFNGLMCIQGADARRAALREIRRVVRPGGRLLLTAHDRENGENRNRWAAEPAPAEGELGDRWHGSDTGPVFLHAGTEAETRAELEAAGWSVRLTAMRSELADEPPAVREFSDDTRWFVAEAEA